MVNARLTQLLAEERRQDLLATARVVQPPRATRRARRSFPGRRA